MRYLTPILVAGTILLCAAPAHADLGDQLAKLVPADGAEHDHFGESVCISGDTAIIGTKLDDDNGDKSGSAYIFALSDGVWTQQAKLLPADGAEGDRFGISVSISGDTAIIGAIYDEDNGSRSGSAYIFARSEGVWTQQAKLLPTDGGADDHFGWSVFVSDDTAVIGAVRDDNNGIVSGSAYIFTRSEGVWTQQAKLLQTDGAELDRFGLSVSISGDTAVIGAYRDDDNGYNSGSAYIFARSGGVWTQQAKLLPSDGAIEDWFGWSVSISGDTAVIGARMDDDNGSNSGSAYIFARSGGVWTQQAHLLPADGVAEDFFGWSVSISDDTAVIGAVRYDDNGSNSGSAYIFALTEGVWTQQAKLLPTEGEAYNLFGASVSISGDKAVIGAWGDRDNGTYSGSAYIFDAGTSNRTTATLTNFSIETGALLNGGLADLESSDDSYVHTRSGFGQTLVDLHNMEMVVSAVTNVDSATLIDLKIESRIDEPAGLAQIRMRNWNTNQFDSVGSYSIGNIDHIDLINNIDATNYIDGKGNIDLSIKHLVFVPFLAFTFESYIDQVELYVN